MRTLNRICIEDYTITAENGDCLKLERGKEYLTSETKTDGTCTVFSNFWVPVPAKVFAGEKVFTEK
jgi:hypothetical protein